MPMSDADKDSRRVGRDELNLAEFPIAGLAERVPSGLKTLTFADRQGTLTVVGSDTYGLPAAPDSDVIVALLHLTKLRNNFTDPTVEFTRYEVLKLLGWPDQKHYYRRLDESLNRWVTVTLSYEGAWWDNAIKCRVDAKFHIIDRVVIYDQEVRHALRARLQPLPLSNFTWGKDFFASCQANNLKRLDLGVYFGLKSAVSKQMYRFLDKKFHLRRDWTFDLREFAHGHVGLARTYSNAGKLKAKLGPALEELERIGFLELMTNSDRYSRTGRGQWSIRVVQKQPPPAEAKPAEVKPEPTGLERELVERGITRSVAAELVRDFPEERVRRQLETVDWLRETKPKRIVDVGAYLADAIRKDHAPPARFESKAQRAARETARRAVIEQEAAARRTKAQERQEQDRIKTYRESLTPEQRSALDAEALASADPETRAAYETATTPQLKTMLLTALRETLIRRLLDLPVSG